MDYKYEICNTWQRAEINDLLFQQKFATMYIKALEYMLTEYEGEKVTKNNFDDIIRKIDNDKITELATPIIKEMNGLLDKKK